MASKRIESGSHDEQLDSFTLKQLEEQKKHIQIYQEYHRKVYEELAQQREKYFSELQAVLLEKATRSFQIEGWWRAVRYKYSLHPLSAVGSVKISGRFNFGADIGSSYPTFPALYISENKLTALSETLGQNIIEETKDGLNQYDISLTKPNSETLIAVNGSFDNVYELEDSAQLIKFVNIIKKFKLSSGLRAIAKKNRIDEMNLVTKPKKLLDSILAKSWRKDSALLGTPSNSQIFGQLLSRSGINAVSYPSQHDGKKCLAIFTETFQETSCNISIIGEVPQGIIATELNNTNFKLATMTYDEVNAVRVVTH